MKNLLSQVIQTPDQQKFLYNLLGFDYVVEYKLGIENRAANTLSRHGDNDSSDTLVQGFLLAISRRVSTFLVDLPKEVSQNVKYKEWFDSMIGKLGEGDVHMTNGLVF